MADCQSMRALRPIALILLLAPLAGCLDDSAGSTQSIDEEFGWFVAQADATSGDVVGFVHTLPALPACDLTAASASAEASASGASASAGGASASASSAGASASAPCGMVNVTASADGASVSAGGANVGASFDGFTVEVVPDVSALGSIQDFAFLVFSIQDGVATHLTTVLSTEMERVETRATGAIDRATIAAQTIPFLVNLEGLNLQAGDQIGFVMAAAGGAVDEIQARAAQQLGESADQVSGLGLPVSVPDYGFAFRLVDTARADADKAAAELQALAASAQTTVEGEVAAVQDEAESAIAAGRSILDGAIASGQAKVSTVVGQVQGYDLGLYLEEATGGVQGMANVRYLTDSLQVDYGINANPIRAFASVQEVTLSYEGPAATGFGLGIGGYGGQENGQVDYNVDANVFGQGFSQNGAITAVGPLSQGVDPFYVLEGTGNQAQSLVFELQRKAQDSATHLFALHMNIAGTIQDLLGSTVELLPVTEFSVDVPMPATFTGSEFSIAAPSIGPVRVLGVN